MGVFTFEDETISTVAPATLFKALAIDADTIIPKAVEAIQSVETVEGNGGPGTIKKLTLINGGETKYILHQIDAIDEANLVYNYSNVGGVGSPHIVEKISIETKLVEGANGGSIGKVTIKIETEGDAQPNEEEGEAAKARGEAFFKAIEAFYKAIEAYLSANP